MMADVAFYNSDCTPLKSGAALADSRLRASMTYDNWYFFADFTFGKNKVRQDDIYLRYSWKNVHAIKVGHYYDPSNMAGNTSLGSYHFISRPAPTRALEAGRQLGISYAYMGENFFANQGIFAENLYNDQSAGLQGITISGRWLWRTIRSEKSAFHIGISARYAHITSGIDCQGTVQTSVTLSTPFETYVDGNSSLMNAHIPWASDVLNIGAEFVWVAPKSFIRGKYIWKHIGKKRDDQKLFDSQSASEPSWDSLESWQKDNPLRASDFSGAYIEAGWILLGNTYRYNSKKALVGGIPDKSLELVAHYSYTNLNDINKGEYYDLAQNKYVDNSASSSPLAESTSVGGGRLHAATIGLNYSFNKYVQLLAHYTYNNYKRDKNPSDRDFHTIQGRVVFTF